MSELPRKLVWPDGSITYRTIDKSAWGPGPWQDEPDKVQWTDEATGLPCLMLRSRHGGNWCGYVGVAPDHPAFGLSYDGERSEERKAYTAQFRASLFGGVSDKTVKQAAKIERPPVVHGAGEKVAEIRVHGGLTYADVCQQGDEAETICHVPATGQPDNVWWFGFDCAHVWDFSPAMDADLRRMGIRHGAGPQDEDVYRDQAYVRSQVTHLAHQLKAIT